MAEVDQSLRDDRQPSAGGGMKRDAEEAFGTVPDEEPKLTEEDPGARGTESGETIEIKVQFGKISKVVTRRADSTVADLKQEIEKQTGVPCANQKLLFKGQLKDASTLREAGLKQGSKLMVIGTKPEDTKVATTTKPVAVSADWDAAAKKEPWSEMPQHKKILDKGRPDDGWAGIKDRQIPLRDDQTYIPGLLNSQGTLVRLTFRQDLQQLWIGSAVSTQKIFYQSVHKIEAQPIVGQEEYSIMRLQVGAAASSNYWLYFVPSQSVASVKVRVRGVASLLE